MIVILAGLPGTGKTTLAHAMAEAVHGVVLNKDAIRSALFPAPLIEYSVRQDDFCHGVMLDTARYLLGAYPSIWVFLDGRTYSRSYQLEFAIRSAEAIPAPWKILECTCPDEVALQRIASQPEHPAANRNEELYWKMKRAREPVTRPKFVLDTSAPLGDCLARALAACRS